MAEEAATRRVGVDDAQPRIQHHHAERRQVEQAFEAHVRGAPRRLRFADEEQCAHRRNESHRIGGMREVAVRSHLHAQRPVGVVRERGRQVHDRNVRVLRAGAQLTAHLEPVDVRQVHVEDEQVDGGIRQGKRFAAGAGFDDVEARRLEHAHRAVAGAVVIVDDEDARAAGGRLHADLPWSGCSSRTGITTQKRDPSPSVLSAPTRPPSSSANLRDRDRPETRAPQASLQPRIHLHEIREQLRQVLRSDADARVDDRELDLVPVQHARADAHVCRCA